MGTYQFALKDGRRVVIEFIPAGMSGDPDSDAGQWPTYRLYVGGARVGGIYLCCAASRGSGWSVGDIEIYERKRLEQE